MANSKRNKPVCEKNRTTLPQGVPVSMTNLLEANIEFHNEILAFKPQELLSECK